MCSSIFTKAKAGRKLIGLMDDECGIPRSKLRCDSRLEADLGVYGDDTWELLERLHRECGVSFEGVNLEGRVTPEVQPPPAGFLGAIFLASMLAGLAAPVMVMLIPVLSGGMLFGFLLLLSVGFVIRQQPANRQFADEITIR